MSHRIQLWGPTPPPHGAISFHLKQLQATLTRNGYSAEWGDPIGDFNKAHSDSNRLTKAYHSLFHFPALLPANPQERPDILHDHQRLYRYTNPIVSYRYLKALLELKRAGTKLVATIHDPFFGKMLGERRANPVRTGNFLQVYDRIVAIDDNVKEWIMACGVAPEKIVVIPAVLPIAAEELATVALTDPQEAFRAAHHPLVFCSGGLWEVYHYPVLLSAFRDVLKVHPEAGLILCSHSSKIDVSTMHLLDAPPADIVPHILDLRDIPPENALKLTSLADIVARTAYPDGQPLSLYHAMALGKPVVASETGTRPAGIAQYPFDDPVKLAESVLGILADPVSWASWKQQYQTMLQKYESLLFELYQWLMPPGF